MKVLTEEKVEGMRTRSRTKEIKLGAIPSKFFSRMENTRGGSQLIHGLTDSKGDHDATEEILESATRFYTDLYGEVDETEESEEAQRELLDCVGKRLEDEDCDEVDRDFTLQEVKDAIGRAGRGRAPGPDGLTAELYVHFADLLAPQLLALYRKIEERKELTPTQKDATIILLYKKGDRRDIKNYRPISLLNVDLKIMTKVLSTRVGNVMGSVVGEGQTLVKGRYIHESVKVVLDMMHHLGNSNTKGIILLLDQEKAFDRVSWTYLKKIVEEFGFGPRFLVWLDILYSDSKATLKINNTMGSNFEIRRGVRQGDPLSPLLYVLAIEGLAAMIRKNKSNEGIEVPGWHGRCLKYLMYADDTAIFVKSASELIATKKILATFERASNARLNWAKSIAIRYGNIAIRAGVWQGRWLGDHEVTKYLGVPITKDLDLELMWAAGLEGLKNSFKFWGSRFLTLAGRRVIVNTFIYPKLYYLLQALPLGKCFHERIEGTLRKFLWRGGVPPINMATCYLPVQGEWASEIYG